MTKVKENLNKILWFYLLLNPFLDIVSGSYIYYQYGHLLNVNEASIGLTPSLVIRMAMLLFFAVYILIMRDKKAILAAVPMIVAFCLSVASEYVRLGSVNEMTDAQYFTKFFYNILILFVYADYCKTCGLSRDELLERIHKMLCIVSFILVAGIIIPFIFDFGFFTYADRFGYRGFRGIYYSGNDITATLMLITPITLCNYLSLSSRKRLGWKRWLFYGLAPVLSTLCLLLIGTKTAYMAVAICVVLILLYGIFRKLRCSRSDRTLLGVVIYALAVLVSMALLSVVAQHSVFASILNSFSGIDSAAKESTQTLVLSGRQIKLHDTLSLFKNGGPATWVFGLGRGAVTKVIEMDVFEVLFYYGVFGAVCMLWIYCKAGINFIAGFFKHINFNTLGAFISLGTCVCYFIIAGHVLFSVTSGFFFAFLIVYGTYLLSGEKLLPYVSAPRPEAKKRD